jgi:hypothetical protein
MRRASLILGAGLRPVNRCWLSNASSGASISVQGKESNMSTTANPMTGNKCAHPGCTCQVEPGQQYCSTACADSVRQGKGSSECGCNHDGCALAA